MTLNHPTFNHTTINHRPVIDCAFSNMPIKTENGQNVNTTTRPYFRYKRRLIMKRGSGYCKQNKMQLKVGILVCRHFSIVTIQHCGLSCKISKRSSKATFIVSTKIASAQPSVTYVHGCDAVNKDKCPDLLSQSDSLCQVVNVSMDINVFIGFCMCNRDYVVWWLLSDYVSVINFYVLKCLIMQWLTIAWWNV